MFNSKKISDLESRIKHLEQALSDKLNQVQELQSHLTLLQTNKAYLEGTLKAKDEIIEGLKSQLMNEVSQRDAFQKTFLNMYSPPMDKTLEAMSGIYDEDEDVVADIKEGFIKEDGDL